MNGVLIPVRCLINGASIAQVPTKQVIYYHVELTRHEVILAEALPVESYLEAGDRWRFENGDAAIELHPDFSSLKWEAEGCAPLVIVGPEVDAVRRWVNSRVAETAVVPAAATR